VRTYNLLTAGSSCRLLSRLNPNGGRSGVRSRVRSIETELSVSQRAGCKFAHEAAVRDTSVSCLE
jgi:hypothetical protein